MTPPEPAPAAPRRAPERVVVLDTAALLAGLGPALAGTLQATWLVPPAVRAEVRPGGATGRAVERAEAAGLRVQAPDPAALEAARAAAGASGDLARLSAADLEALALAETLRRSGQAAELWSDDFAVQNVAARLGVPCRPATGRRIAETVQWHIRCTGCGRYLERGAPGDPCPVCGSPLKRTRRAPGPR